MYWLYGLLTWYTWVLIDATDLAGLNYLISGFDAARMVSIDEISAGDLSKFRLFDLDESTSKSYTVTIGNQKQDFIVPSVVQVNDVSMASILSVESISKSYTEFISQYYSSFSFGLNIVFPIEYIPVTLKLGFDSTVKEIYQLMQSRYTAMATSTAWWGMYSIQLPPAYLLKFNSMFNRSLSKLVENPTTERQQAFYNEIVVAFGTHYVSTVTVGGLAFYYTLLTDEWQRTNSQSSTENQVSIGFQLGFDIPLNKDVSIAFGKEFGGIFFGGSWGYSSGAQSEVFKKNSATKFLFRPSPLGSSSSTQNHSLDAWISQAARQPVVVNRTLFSLSNLLLDYPTAIAEHLQRTIDFYLMNGRLPKLNDVLLKGRLSTDTSMPIPGLDVVGCGYDIINLQNKQCIFEVTYNHNNLWSRIFNGQRSYRIPDGFSVRGTQELYPTYETQIFNDYDRFMQNSIYINQQDPVNFLGFGASYQRSEIAQRLRNIYKHRLNLAWTKQQIQWYNLSMVTSRASSLNAAAETALNNLPSIFSEQDFSTIWKRFFDTYGTHYVVSADFGGMVWAEDYFDPCMITKYSLQWIKDQISRSYCFVLRGEDSCLCSLPIDQDYRKHHISMMKIIGGQSDIHPFQLKKWLQTIKDRPHAISYSLQPFYTLLPSDSQKRTALEEATLYIRSQAASVTNTVINNLKFIQQPSPVPPVECNSTSQQQH